MRKIKVTVVVYKLNTYMFSKNVGALNNHLKIFYTKKFLTIAVNVYE